MKIIFIFLCVFIGFGIYAQKINHILTDFSDKKFVIKYDISGPEKQKCEVRLFVSVDKGKTFDREVFDASGDVGDKIEIGKKKKIIWDVSNENLDIEKVKFSLQIMALGLPPKKKKN